MEVVGGFGEIWKGLVGQVDEELLHVLARHFDEVAAHAVADTARAAVQHEPDGFRLVEAHFDEVVAGAERAKVIGVVAAIELGMLLENGVVTRLQRLPDFVVAGGNLPPSANVSASAMICAPMRHRLLDRAPNALQTIRKIPP